MNGYTYTKTLRVGDTIDWGRVPEYVVAVKLLEEDEPTAINKDGRQRYREGHPWTKGWFIKNENTYSRPKGMSLNDYAYTKALRPRGTIDWEKVPEYVVTMKLHEDDEPTVVDKDGRQRLWEYHPWTKVRVARDEDTYDRPEEVSLKSKKFWMVAAESNSGAKDRHGNPSYPDNGGTCNSPPRARFDSAKKAKEVADEMARSYGGRFYILEAVEYVEQQEKPLVHMAL